MDTQIRPIALVVAARTNDPHLATIDGGALSGQTYGERASMARFLLRSEPMAAKKKSKDRSAVSVLLIRQHNQVKAIFKKLESGRSDAQPLLEELANNLSAHMTIEQEIYYPAVKSLKEDLINESYEEHSLAELGLKRLLATDPEDESFKAKVTACKELIEHHVEEEEDELFPGVDRKMKDEVMKEMAKRMKARFDEVVAAGFDAAVPKGFGKTSADVSRGKPKSKPKEKPGLAARVGQMLAPE